MIFDLPLHISLNILIAAQITQRHLFENVYIFFNFYTQNLKVMLLLEKRNSETGLSNRYKLLIPHTQQFSMYSSSAVIQFRRGEYGF